MPIPVRTLILHGLRSLFVAPRTGTGGTVSARYCYSVFMRHRIVAAAAGLRNIPRCVVELGPGDSLGTGLMAILTGTQRYYAVDVVRHASPAANLAVLDEIVALLRSRAPIPHDGECAEIRPELRSYEFPMSIFNEGSLNQALSPSRLSMIRKTLIGSERDSPIQYLAPLGEMSTIPGGSVDWVFSQAVMEHVDDPGSIYRECFRCLGPAGIMTHQIDYRCHETAPEWNGHWKYSGWLWSLMRGHRPWFINRIPHSVHMRMQREAGFDIRDDIKQIQTEGIAHSQLSRQFRWLSASDLQIAGALITGSKVSGVTPKRRLAETDTASRTNTAQLS